jgi:hypothetical protein
VPAERALGLPVNIVVDRLHSPTVKAASPEARTQAASTNRPCCTRSQTRPGSFTHSTDINRLDIATLANLAITTAAIYQQAILAAHVAALEPARYLATTRGRVITEAAEIRQTISGTSSDRPDVATAPALARHTLTHGRGRAGRGGCEQALGGDPHLRRPPRQLDAQPTSERCARRP